MTVLSNHNGGTQVLSSAATGLADFLASRRLSPDSLFERVRLDINKLSSPIATIGLDQYCGILEISARQAQDPNIGLDYGQQFIPENLGLIGHIAISSSNLIGAAENLARYFKYHQQSTTTELHYSEPFFHLTYRIHSDKIQARAQDAIVTLGMFCNVFRHCAGQDWCPDEVLLEQRTAENRAEIERAFGAPLRLGCRTNALVFRPERASLPMPKSNPQLLSLLCHNIVQLGMGEAKKSISEQVRAVIRENIGVNSLDIDFVSNAVGVPRWTLQRRLAENNITFAGLVDEIRKEIAQNCLLDQDIDVEVIATILGYSEPSAFSRAFKRWHPMTPSEYRKFHRKATIDR